MAGRITAAFSLALQIWESLINGKYMKEAHQYEKRPCRTCGSGRLCHNYFCLQCKTAGLCPAVFSGDHEHRHHPWLQVRHYSGRYYSVLSSDLANFISEEGLKHIHCTIEGKNGQRHCNLTSKSVGKSSKRARASAAGKKRCQGCKASLHDHGSKNPTPKTFLVCSLQCLLKVARGRRSERHLCAVKRGAMERAMAPPLSNPDKLRLNRSRTPQTPLTVTPSRDEAPPSPTQVANGDSHETDEAASAAPVVEAPPVAGGSSRLEYHEPDFSEDFESLDAAVRAFLPVPDDCLTLPGTPAFWGELLHFH